MQRIARLPEWIWRARPSIFILPIIGLHIAIQSFSGLDKVFVNEIIGQLLTLLGGLVVVGSMNDDFQEFRNKNMLLAFKEYLKSCPLLKQNHILDAEAGIYTTTFGNVHASITYANEGDIERIERRLEELFKIQKDTNERIAKLYKEFLDLHIKNKEGISQVRNQLDKTIIGNARYQIFGVLLILYGVVVNFILLFQ